MEKIAVCILRRLWLRCLKWFGCCLLVGYWLFSFPTLARAACIADYSGIDGNLIPNPYFECDANSDSIPDGWEKNKTDANRILSWVDDPAGGGHNKVLKMEITNSAGLGTTWRTVSNLSLTADQWYQLSVTAYTEGLIPNLNTDNTIKSSSDFVDVDITRYSAANNKLIWPRSYINFPNLAFADWDDAVKVYRTYTTTSATGWVTKTIYFKTSPIDSYGRVNISFYPKGIMMIADVTLKKIANNTNPENVSISRSGTLSFLKYKGNDFFPIFMDDYPTSGGQDIDIDTLKNAGFNTAPTRYRSYTDSEYQDILTQKDMAVELIFTGLTLATGYGYYWHDDPTHAVPYFGWTTDVDRINAWKNYDGVALVETTDDEMDCTPYSGGTYPGYNDGVEDLIDLVKNNTSFPVYGNFCADTATNDIDDQVDNYVHLVDVFSTTRNCPTAYVATSGDYSGSPRLPLVGYKLREINSKLVERGFTRAKPLAFALGTYYAANWDGTLSTNEYVPYNLQRFLIWDQIINGAIGVRFFVTGVNIDDAYYAYHFNQMKALAGELSSLREVLEEPKYYDDWTVSDDRVEVMMKKHDGEIYLLTASTAYEDLSDIKFTLDDSYKISSVTAVSDITNGDFDHPQDRVISFSGDSFTDDFTGETTNSPQGYNAPGYGVHIYRIAYSNNVSTSTGTSAAGAAGLSSSSPPFCGDFLPGATPPSIYKAVSQNKDSVELFFVPAENPVDHYALEYGTQSGHYIYGLNNFGDKNSTSILIQDLTPNTEYYFRIRGGNGCATGPWSNEITAKTQKMMVVPPSGTETAAATSSPQLSPIILPPTNNNIKTSVNTQKNSRLGSVLASFTTSWQPNQFLNPSLIIKGMVLTITLLPIITVFYLKLHKRKQSSDN